MPIIGTLMLSAGASAETKQYDGLQVFLMGVYNTPFLVVSFIGLFTGRTYQSKLNERAASVAYVISIGSSIGGSILMLIWGLGKA